MRHHPSSRPPAALPPVRGLFQQHVRGDDALLRLAQLRFSQYGLSAEVYADTPGQLDRILSFAPAGPALPTVHLNRTVNLLHESDRALVTAFAAGFPGRVAGLVVHDRREMATRVPDLVAAMRALTAGTDGGPYIFLEYATGMEPGQFVDIGERLRDIDRASLCIDIGHVGIWQARTSFAAEHPELDLAALHPSDPRLPDLVDDVVRAVDSALPVVLDLIRSVGRIGKTVHFHLHDGHPLIPGLSDHFSFLTRVPIPFSHEGLYSLPPLYGPAGLAEILRTAVDACGTERASLTLEIHQAEGRLPLADAAGLFGHWRDITNAERLNYWLSVLAENHVLATAALDHAGLDHAGLGPDPVG